MRGLRRAFMAMACGCALLLAGCASMQKSGAATSAAPRAAEPGGGAPLPMIISEAFLSIEVADAEKAVDALVTIAKQHEGYTVSTGSHTVLRVPSASLAVALEAVAAVGTVTSREVREQDVSKRYSDTSLKLENAKAARSRYLELLSKAENVSAALQVEKELERLNGEIALFESDLGNLAHLVQYATISVSISKKVTPGPLGWVFYGLYRVVEWLFVWR
jgi:hypothetical protein